MEEERGRANKMVKMSKCFKEYWPMLVVILMTVAFIVVYSQWIIWDVALFNQCCLS